MSEDIVWVAPPEDPDASVYRGYLGVQRYWDEWREEVGNLHFDPQRFIAVGDSVLVVVRRLGHGRKSGIDVADEVVQVFDFEGDRCYRVREFYDLAASARLVAARARARLRPGRGRGRERRADA